ncbi:hypothetical protein B4129_0707 [Bacillus safensis]|nr:hypothetical protein B4129_0707 [Bacillus safensis]
MSEKGEKHPTCSLFFFSIHPHMQPFEGRIASACSLFFSYEFTSFTVRSTHISY